MAKQLFSQIKNCLDSVYDAFAQLVTCMQSLRALVRHSIFPV